MFASSHSLPQRRAPLHDREGRDSEACHRATVCLLLPEGHPGGWLLLLAGSFVYVAVQVLALRLA